MRQGTDEALILTIEDVDLSGYVKQSDLSAFSNSEIESAVNSAYTSVFGS